MAGVLLHDGRRTGHLGWLVRSVSSGAASGSVMSPFSTPRVAQPRNPSGREVAQAVSGAGGEVIFDPTTHAFSLTGINKRDFYDTWELWGPSGEGLDSSARQVEHVERVYLRQDELGAPHLAPTVTLDSPAGLAAAQALATARVARGLDRGTWQALAGTRSFWASGAGLDAFVGSLAALRSPTWVLTVVNEIVVDNTPDLVATEAFEGLLRTVHSLSTRARVIIANADLAGLPAVAAGADSIGSGWDRSQRTFDPDYFRIDSDPGIRIPASYVTQGRLAAVLRRDAANAIERWNSAQAAVIRGGPMPPSDQAEWFFHIEKLAELLDEVDSRTTRRERVDQLRQTYDTSAAHFDTLIAALPGVVSDRDKRTWCENPRAVLEAYASAEGL